MGGVAHPTYILPKFLLGFQPERHRKSAEGVTCRRDGADLFITIYLLEMALNRYTKYDFLLFIDEISAEFPEVKDYALELVRNRRPVKLIEAIERMTSQPGGATYNEIARQTGFSVMETRDKVGELKHSKTIHVCGWKDEPGHVRKQAAYAYGPGVDVPYPKVVKTRKPLNLGQPKPKRVSKPLERPRYRAKVRVQRDMAASWL